MLPHKESENMFGVGELEDTGTGASVGRVAEEGHHQPAHS